mmetsp:Transcript_89942/g.228812  ORF Transcript_89942/g.228812 Transcript_89942/m.228812 type:complete len:200 (+) Transcript_89942:185-784(+)
MHCRRGPSGNCWRLAEASSRRPGRRCQRPQLDDPLGLTRRRRRRRLRRRQGCFRSAHLAARFPPCVGPRADPPAAEAASRCGLGPTAPRWPPWDMPQAPCRPGSLPMPELPPQPPMTATPRTDRRSCPGSHSHRRRRSRPPRKAGAASSGTAPARRSAPPACGSRRRATRAQRPWQGRGLERPASDPSPRMALPAAWAL